MDRFPYILYIMCYTMWRTNTNRWLVLVFHFSPIHIFSHMHMNNVVVGERFTGPASIRSEKKKNITASMFMWTTLTYALLYN